MAKKQYLCPELETMLFEYDVVLTSDTDGTAINSDQWDNATSGGFDL